MSLPLLCKAGGPPPSSLLIRSERKETRYAKLLLLLLHVARIGEAGGKKAREIGFNLSPQYLPGTVCSHMVLQDDRHNFFSPEHLKYVFLLFRWKEPLFF